MIFLENDKLMDPELARSYMFQMTCVSFQRFLSRFFVDRYEIKKLKYYLGSMFLSFEKSHSPRSQTSKFTHR